MSQKTTISQLLASEQLFDALQQLKPLALKTNDFRMTDRLQSIEQNYKYLLDYFSTGNNDPERKLVLHHIIAETFLLYDDIRAILRKPSPLMLRMRANAADYIADDNKYSRLKKLFYTVWLNGYDSSTELQSSEEKVMLVSAVLLRLVEHFSEAEMLDLCRLAEEYDGEEQNRAIVAVVLVAHIYDSRLKFFPKITERIRMFSLRQDITESMLQVCTQFLNTSLNPLMSKEFESLSKEIEPQIKKDSTNLYISIDEDEDGNPQWGSEVNDGMHRHIGEMARLHEEGADMNYYSTVGILTDGFFHNDIANWFVPFRQDNPEIGVDLDSESGKLLKGIILANVESCDIDSYAMCCIFRRIENQLRNTKMPSIVEDMSKFGDLDEVSQDAKLQNPTLNSVRILYRFLYNNPWGIRNAMADITNVCSGHLFKILCPQKQRSKFGDRCITLGLYKEAFCLFSETSVADLQKKGFILQKQQEFSQALDYFNKAMLYDSDLWTTQHAAACLRALGQNKEALKLYEQMLEQEPDNRQCLYEKAKCLMELAQTEEALQVFFKLDILYPDSRNIQRGVAWCAFLTSDKGHDNYRIAEQYMERLAFADDADSNDLLNYGHLLLATGHRKEAIETYMQSVRKSDLSTFLKQLNPSSEDFKLLLNKGIDAHEILLTTEAVKVKCVS